MALTDIVAGTDADITATGFNCDVDGWSLSMDVATTTYRTFASEWQKSKVVRFSCTGSFTGTIQRSAANTSPIPQSSGTITTDDFKGLSFTATAASGCTYTGTVNITNYSTSRPEADRMVGTFSFEFDGAVTQAWDETA